MTDSAAKPTTLGAFVRVLGRVIEERGVNPADLMRRAGIDPDHVMRPGERVPRTAMTRLWAMAVAETGDPGIGLATAAYFNPATSHALGLGWLASSTLREALTRVCKYHGVLTSGLHMVLRDRDDAIELRLVPSGDESDLAAEAIDSLFAICVRMSRMVLHQDFAPLAVLLSRDDPGQPQAYLESLGIAPHFAADRDAIRVSKQDADRPLPGGNPELATELDRLSERYLAGLDTRRTTATVRSIVEELLPTGRPTLENVARVMRRNPKWIQRRLDNEGASFSGILEQTRKATALRLVRDPGVSLSRIAQVLGFSDQSNFNRAFRRWTGDSPGSFRGRSGD